VLALWDSRRFGLGHYLFPASYGSHSARPFCADQVIYRLIELFEARGSRAESLNAWLIGGACRPGRFDLIELSDKNICEGYELLENKKILIKGIQIGGYHGRRVFVHYPGTNIEIQPLKTQLSADWLILNAPAEQLA
jgi:chemotaxis receptor (MCP) glutamine deamidase CheD